MNQPQREFTKKEIDKHNEEIDRLYYKINQNAMFAFLGTSLAIAIFAIENEQQAINEVLENFIGVMSAASVVINAASGTKRIVERELLKQEVRKMEYDLQMEELEHPKEYLKK